MSNNSYLTLKQGNTIYDEHKYTVRGLNRIRNKLIAISLATMIVFGLLFSNIFTISHIVSGSMVPTLAVGEISFMRCVFGPGDLKRGDIVLFNPITEFNQDAADFLGNGENYYIKRLIGLPGERIRIVNDVVYINDVPLDEPYTVYPEVRTSLVEDRNMSEITIPDGYYFFMGDNRDHSYDSRYRVGIIPYENIESKVIFHFTSLGARILGTDNDKYFID